MKEINKIKITKWGNSLGIRLPSVLLDSVSLSEGKYVFLEKDKDFIKIKPEINDFQNLPLKDILKGVKRSDLESNLDDYFGKAVGKEIW